MKVYSAAVISFSCNYITLSNGSKNTLSVYDSFGDLKTNLDLVADVIAIYCIIGILSSVKNNGEAIIYQII